MSLLWDYVKGEKRGIIAGIIFCIIFAAVFSQYNLPFEAIWYPICLCVLAGLVFLVSGYLAARKKHQQLVQIGRLNAAMIEELPEADKIAEKDYQSIVRMLQAEIRTLETNDSLKYEDMLGYYTIWVHQIKTPIASMRLKLEREDSAMARGLKSDLLRIEQYVEMVLAFLRLDSSSHDYVFRECSVDEIVRRAVKNFSNEFIDRKIALLYTPIDKTVVTDEKWLLFVLEQMISNALKYTKEGNIRIYMTKSEAQRDVLCIEDSGIGIAPEDLPRIFEKGYTGYNGRTDRRATGLGLYLCKRICDQLGISIAAASEVGKGTTIKLNLSQYQLKSE